MYNWCMELYGRQFWSMEVNPGVCFVDWMELNGRQFWSMEVNPDVCLVHGIIW